MAPKVNKQPRAEAQSVLDALADQSPVDPAAIQQPEPAPVADSKPQLTATEQLILNELERTRRELDSLKATAPMATYTPPVDPQLPPPPPALNLDGLPDPITQSAQYNTELAKRVEAHTNATLEHRQRVEQIQRTSASSREAAAAGVWEDFQIQYPELAEHDDRVQFVAQKVVDAAVKRGIDRDRYIFGNAQRFMADVAREYGRIFGTEEPDGTPDEPVARRANPNDDEGRTTGIFGGAHSQSNLGKGSQDKPGDMIKELQDRQRRSGFF